MTAIRLLALVAGLFVTLSGNSACNAGGEQSAVLDRYIAERESAFDGLAVLLEDGCARRAAEADVDPCADGYVDLDAWGETLPATLESALERYCGLLELGGDYAAVARALVIYRVNRALRARGSPVFRSSACPPAAAPA